MHLNGAHQLVGYADGNLDQGKYKYHKGEKQKLYWKD